MIKKTDKIFIEKGIRLPVLEEFYTIQGEGTHSGSAAFFIRLGGCDIGCEWCDSKFSWDPEYHHLSDVHDIVRNIEKNKKIHTIVITGGEPSLYNLGALCALLKKNNYNLHIETSGTHKLTGEWDWICLSPKKKCPPLPSYYNIANELKVIINDDDDFHWAEDNAKKVTGNCNLFLQPEWSKSEKLIPTMVNYVKSNTKWKISLQIHKYMHIP